MAPVSGTRFSICIPNYNYLRYLRLTYDSVKAQSFTNFEVSISDNCSTDGSAEFIADTAAKANNVRVNFNETNLGFAPNLELASAQATGDFFILLSSDDLMNPGCLEIYDRIISLQQGKKFVLGSAVNKIDSDGKIISYMSVDPVLWKKTDIDERLSTEMGCTVYRVTGGEMLRRCLQTMGNPYYFLSVCYPREMYKTVGGYSGGRMFGPDKWFNWKLFWQAESVLFIDKPLFSYRWHTQNQIAMESTAGHLKYLVDDYRNTIELSDPMLTAAGLTRNAAEKAFVERDIYRHGIGEFSKGRWLKSVRVFFFGLATFPKLTLLKPLFIPYLVLLLTTPIGAWISRYLFYRQKNR